MYFIDHVYIKKVNYQGKMLMNYVKWYLTSRNVYQSFVQLVSEQCREHVTVLSALYRANTLSLIFVNSPQEDMSFYSDTSF